MIISFKKESAEISSRKKWLIIGIIIAVLNPIFSGLIISLAYLSEPNLRKEGKIVLIITLIWGLVFAYIIDWLGGLGYI